ncbi:MAG: MFS transporter [Paenibacillaceae bacterium]|nr:MFS transporter [Paenibacillaceae bacterium]
MKDIQSSTRRWWILGVLALSLLVIGLDMTVLNLAMPALAEDLQATTSQLQWFANAYNLVLAAMLLPAGLFGDRFGSKKVLLTALLLFGGASVACALAGDAGFLIAARAVLGLGAALMMPVSLSMLSVLFTDEERPKAMRIWVTATALGMPLGPILGGWLLDRYAWGSIFWINVPIVAIALVAVAILLPRGRGSDRIKADVPGMLLSGGGLAALTYGVTRSGDKGWGDPGTIVFVLVSILLLAAFVWRQRKAAHPLVRLELFREPRFAWGASLATLVNCAMFGVLFGLPLFFQAVNGVNSQTTGLRILPLIGGLIVGAQLSGKLAARLGDKAIVGIGFLLMAVGLGLGALTDVSTGYGYIAFWVALGGVGIGFALPAAMDAALGALPPGSSGVGSALTMAMRQVGGTLGVALLGAILNAAYRGGLQTAQVPGEAAEAMRANVTAGIAVAKQMKSADLLAAVQSAFASGMDAMLWASGGIAILGLLLTMAFLKNRKKASSSSETNVPANMA